MSEAETPDWSKPLSRWNATYWAMQHGIAAALEASEWKVLGAIYHHLPNVHPGKGRLEQLAGVSTSSVKRARKALKAAGLINFDEGFRGGSHGETTHYTVTDIRVSEVAAAIVARLTGAKVTPVTGATMNPVHSERGSSWTPTGVIVNPHGGHGEPPTGAIVNPKVHNLSSQESSQEKSEGAAVPPTPEGGVSLPQNEAGVQPSVSEAQPAGPQGQYERTRPSEPKAQASQTSGEQDVRVPEPSDIKASVKTNASNAQPSERARPRGDAAGRGTVITNDDFQKERVRQLACKSLAHMEHYLMFGEEGVQLLDDGKPEEAAKLKPFKLNWRQFFETDNQRRVIVENGRPLGMHSMTASAFAGWYWFTISYYYHTKGRPMCHPGNYNRLVGKIKNALAEWGPNELFDRMAAFGQHYDAIMSLKNIYGEWPDETSLGNGLVDAAYAQWAALGEQEREAVRERLLARNEAA